MVEESVDHGAPMEKSPKGRRGRTTQSVDASPILTLRWTLQELPSSQHRAGLAGLALCVAFLKRKPDRRGVCGVERIDADELVLAVDRVGMQELFDDVYDASLDEQERDKKLQKGKGSSKTDLPPKRTEERQVTDQKTQKSKLKTIYVYDQVVPRGALIEDLHVAPDGKKLALLTFRWVPEQQAAA